MLGAAQICRLGRLFPLGLAYIGRFTPTFNYQLATNITFTTDSTVTTPWTIAANSTSVTFNETLALFVDTFSNAFSQVGFVNSNGTLPINVTTTGFTWFGTSVAFATSGSDLEMVFWANATSDPNIWGLFWNTGGNPPQDSFPVTLKKTPPTVGLQTGRF